MSYFIFIGQQTGQGLLKAPYEDVHENCPTTTRRRGELYAYDPFGSRIGVQWQRKLR